MLISVEITRQENAQHYGVEIGDVVNVPLEDYVAGVVASEIGNAAAQAAMAQAVAARTFAWNYYSKGHVISDSSRHQAFRAARIDAAHYPRAIQAAKDTAGQLLRYDGKVLNACSYSASNGGRTVSSQERWGGARPWLIAQDDPWDAAVGGSRTGHGVGMSQRGACYAASIGVGYREILAFYYPGTEIWTEGGVDMVNEKADRAVRCAEAQLGGPYVFGAWGAPCTPEERRKRAGSNPSHEAAIVKDCQVLNGKAISCDGCKWQDWLCWDCRGFVHWTFLQVGIDITGQGATSQYNTADNWVERGEIGSMPDVVCAVYKFRDGKMIHTGVHAGSGRIIHCSAGVQEGKITDAGWTHYAVPVGLYTKEELQAAERVKIMTTIRNGDKGEAVTQLQNALKRLGYFEDGTVDGIFGSMTAASLRCFQSDQGLVVDAICGTKTWAAINEALNALETVQEDQQEEPQGDPTEGPADQPAPAWAALVQQMREVCAQIDQQKQKLDGLIEAAEKMLGA